MRVEEEMCECICISGNQRSMVATDAELAICICLISQPPPTHQVIQVIHAHHIRKLGKGGGDIHESIQLDV